MTQELTQAATLITKAQALQVHDSKQAKIATEVLSRANKALDLLEEKETERTARLKEELAFIRAPYAEPKKALKAIIADLRIKLGAYQTEHTQQAAKEAQGIAARAEAGRLKPETAVRQLDAIVTPAAKIEATAGSLSFRPKKTLKIVDSKKIPRAFLIPDEEMILWALTNGAPVAGCEIEIIQVPFNRRA